MCICASTFKHNSVQLKILNGTEFEKQTKGCKKANDVQEEQTNQYGRRNFILKKQLRPSAAIFNAFVQDL